MPGPQGLKSTKEFNKSKDIPIRDLAAGVMGRTYLGCEDVTEDVDYRDAATAEKLSDCCTKPESHLMHPFVIECRK